MTRTYNARELLDILASPKVKNSGSQLLRPRQKEERIRSQVFDAILNSPPQETNDEILKLSYMLNVIPADCEYSNWRDIGWSILSTGWTCAPLIFKKWSMTAPHRYHEEGLLQVIESFDPNGGIHYGTLVHHAKQHGWQESKIETYGASFRVTLASNLLQTPPPVAWTVYGLLPPDAIIFVNGPPASGKSLTVLDISCSIATGKRWHGRAVQQGPVIYIAGEGHAGIRRRLKAWAIHNAADLSAAPLAVSETGANFADPSSVQSVQSAIDEFAEQHGAPVLIIIDTLHRNFVGDENSAQDMGAYIFHIDYIRNQYGCSVMTVHHTGHKAQDRARGSSSIQAAADTEFIVKPEGDRELLVTCSKMKDAAKPESMAFEIVQVELPWMDVLGMNETSVTVEPITVSISGKNRQLSEGLKLGIQTLHAATGKAKSAHLVHWKKQFYDNYKDGATTRAKNQAFNRMKKELLTGNVVRVVGEQYSLTDGAESFFTDVTELIQSLNGVTEDENP